MPMPFASMYRRVLSAWTAMAVRQHGLGYLIGITAIVGMTVFSQLASWRPASATAHAQQQLTGTIAYADMAGDSIRLIEPDGRNEPIVGPIHCSQRLGGMLRFYHCDAA